MESPILQAIGYGIHAPNPHNIQAWKFESISETEALPYIDERGLLPATDPPTRQIHIGAGSVIETLRRSGWSCESGGGAGVRRAAPRSSGLRRVTAFAWVASSDHNLDLTKETPQCKCRS
jgi:hypothetical protein